MTDTAARTFAGYTAEPGEYEDPPVVWCRTAGGLRLECVSGCIYDCWHPEEDDRAWDCRCNCSGDRVQLVQIDPF